VILIELFSLQLIPPSLGLYAALKENGKLIVLIGVTTLGLALVSIIPMNVLSTFHTSMIKTNLISKQFSDSIFYIIMINVIFSLISYLLSLFVFKIAANSLTNNRE
jgi:hypothetical protein